MRSCITMIISRVLDHQIYSHLYYIPQHLHLSDFVAIWCLKPGWNVILSQYLMVFITGNGYLSTAPDSLYEKKEYCLRVGYSLATETSINKWLNIYEFKLNDDITTTDKTPQDDVYVLWDLRNIPQLHLILLALLTHLCDSIRNTFRTLIRTTPQRHLWGSNNDYGS